MRYNRILGTGLATITFFAAAFAEANVTLKQLSTDPFTNPSSQHKTQVEPDTFAYGKTIVSAFQVGRFVNGGGSSGIGWATSTDGGKTWKRGFLPGITKYKGNGPYDRATDPSVAYDPKRGVWLISSLGFFKPPSLLGAVVVSRSEDGIHWSNPKVVEAESGQDKNWTACDTSATSPYYGNCYTQWDNFSDRGRIKMSTSKDGGLTWSAAAETANRATGIGGQPVVNRQGVVTVPIANANISAILAFNSTDGGATWSATQKVASVIDHQVSGGLRYAALPSAEIDRKGRVYVVWSDCRFRKGCSSNDIVMSTLRNGTWSPVVRIPIDPIKSGVDHFIPGIAVDRQSGGTQPAHIVLTYYYYPVANCTTNCKLNVGAISSTDGGTTWSKPTQLAGPMELSWLADTSLGRMVGDYISGSFVDGTVRSVFAVANAPKGGVFDEAMYTTATGLVRASGGRVPVANDPVQASVGDRRVSTGPLNIR
ncbi:MAG: sialidase family protein [Thermosynechococcaceae cyanobacterium]